MARWPSFLRLPAVTGIIYGARIVTDGDSDQMTGLTTGCSHCGTPLYPLPHRHLPGLQWTCDHATWGPVTKGALKAWWRWYRQVMSGRRSVPPWMRTFKADFIVAKQMIKEAP